MCLAGSAIDYGIARGTRPKTTRRERAKFGNIFNFRPYPLQQQHSARCEDARRPNVPNSMGKHTPAHTNTTWTRRNFDPKLKPPAHTPTTTKCLIRSSAAPSLSGHEISDTVAPPAELLQPTLPPDLAGTTVRAVGGGCVAKRRAAFHSD